MANVIYYFRWILILPSSIMAALAANFVLNLINKLSLLMEGWNPDGFVSHVYTLAMAGGGLGAAFVYAGARVAPAHKKQVAFVLAGLGLVCVGIMVFPAVAMKQYWALWQCFWIAAGAGITTYAISEDGELVSQPWLNAGS